MPDIGGVPSTTEEIEAIYDSGRQATVALIGQLVALISSQQQTIAQLTQCNAELTQRITELEQRLNRNSRNSSQPPSSDGFNRPPPRPRSLLQPTGKKSGGQPGHKGKTLRFSAHPDRVVEHRAGECAECGCPLEDVPALAEGTERRQVIDLPPLKLETTEHHSHLVRCPLCQHLNRGAFPAEAVDAVQYGPQLKAVCVYLMSYQLLPYERTAQLLTDLFGQAPSEGTLHQVQQQAAPSLTQVEDAIKESLRQHARVGHFDETGVYIEGRREWLHVASTPSLTLYHSHRKRGEEGTRAMGVLPGFRGVAVHDGFQSFRVYECSHALCNAHHLRELQALEEQGEEWAKQMKGLLVQIKGVVVAAQAGGQGCLEPQSLLEFEGRYRQLVQEGLEANPPNPPPKEPRKGRVKQSKAYNLLVRLRDYREDVLRFMHDFDVPFDNNQAERDLRMAKVRQKAWAPLWLFSQPEWCPGLLPHQRLHLYFA